MYALVDIQGKMLKTKKGLLIIRETLQEIKRARALVLNNPKQYIEGDFNGVYIARNNAPWSIYEPS